MIKSKKYIIVNFITILLLFITTTLYSKQYNKTKDNQRIKITGDKIESLIKKDIINVKGNVRVFYGSTTIIADNLEYNRNKKLIKAIGNVSLKEEGEQIKGDNIYYDLGMSTGEVKKPIFFSDPWILRGNVARKVDKETFILKKSYFTSCTESEPHYKFNASKVKLRLKKSLLAYHVFLTIKGIPVLYLPIVYQSLRNLKPEIEVDLGRNDREGVFYKLRVMYPFNQEDKLTTYIDKFEYQGIGFGLQYNYMRKDKIKGSLYGYYIEDQKTVSRRYKTDISHWQKLNNYLSSSLKFNYRTDESFGSDPALFNEDSINRDINSYMSFNYNKNKLSVNLAWDRVDRWSYDDNTSTKGSFKKIQEVLPNFSLNKSKTKLINRYLYYSYGLNLVNRYSALKKSYFGSGSSNFSLASSLRFSRTFNISPIVTIYEDWDNDLEGESFKESFATRLQTSVNGRKRISRWGTLDLTHNFSQYLYKNNYNSGEILSNNILTNFLIRPNRKLRTSFSSGYNLNMDTGDCIKRLYPISTLITFRPNSRLYFYLRDTYDTVNGITDLLQTQISLNQKKWNFSNTATFRGDNKNFIDINNSLYINLNDKWKIENNLRYEYNMGEPLFKSALSYFQEQKYTVIRDLHCWELKLSWKKLKKTWGFEEETWLMLSIKAIPGQKIGTYHSSQYDKDSDWTFSTGD